jgi:membrane associated rhomboid family serine protease
MPFDNRSAASYRHVIAQAWKRMPVTVLIIALVVGLHLVKIGFELSGKASYRGVDGSLGAAVTLTLLKPEKPGEAKSPMVPVKDLHGQFDLWDGQWWRIPINGLLHANLFHLVTNVLALWALGGLLEPRMQRGWYLAFFFSALVVSLLPEFLLEDDVVGISGALCAQFGMLLPMRRRDWRLREVLNDNAVRTMLIFLVACIPLTMFDIIRIANVAHFSGLFYGWIAGQVFFGTLAAQWVWRAMFFAAHASIPAAVFAIVHPTWNARYFWYEAHHAAVAGNGNQYEADLERAVAIDPGLVECWNELARHQAGNQGGLLDAWRTTLKGLQYNRSNDTGVEIAREIFGQIPTVEGRREAIQILQQAFPDDPANWQARLTRGVASPPLTPALKALLPPEPRFNPDAPDRAAAGRNT